MFDFDKTYWNSQGSLQAQYDEMREAGWEFNKTTVNDFRRYYRFYNDGDATPRMEWLLDNLSWEALKSNREYIAYCQRLEDRATRRIEIEYRRFQRAQL